MKDTLRFESLSSFEEGGTVVLSGDGLKISVAEEKAVDSYNEVFECTLTMSREQVLELRDWLNHHFPIDR